MEKWVGKRIFELATQPLDKVRTHASYQYLKPFPHPGGFYSALQIYLKSRAR